MIPSNRFLKLAAVFFIISLLIITACFYFSLLDKTSFYSIIIAAAIVSFNFLAGFLTIRYGINKPTQIFLLSVFGGMAVRLVLMLVMVLFCLKFLELNPNSFIFSILFFYIFLLTVEIIYLNLRKR